MISGAKSYSLNKDILAAQEKRIDLAEAVGTINDGDEVWLESCVAGGANKTAPQRFIYKRSSDNKACYQINGTTQINTLSYNGIYKVGVVPTSPATYNDIKKIIDDWGQKLTPNNCFWPNIDKSEIVNGLHVIISRYFSQTHTDKYTRFIPLPISDRTQSYYFTGIYQGGKNFMLCGAVAVMFYLAKLNIRTFVGVVMDLYDTGSFMGYQVPNFFRKFKDTEIKEKYYSNLQYIDSSINGIVSITGMECVCWLVQAAIIQRVHLLHIVLDTSASIPDSITADTIKNYLKKHGSNAIFDWDTFLKVMDDLDEIEKGIRMFMTELMMKDTVNFVFNTSNVKIQNLTTWATVNAAKKNLDEWIEYLNNSGTIFWYMHSEALQNLNMKTYLDTNPEPSNKSIRSISLKNNGGFVARVRVKTNSKSYDVNDDILLGQEKTINLAEAINTIKNGDEIWLEVVVKGGKNKTATQHFVYGKASGKRASYTISGTTLINKLHYNGIQQLEKETDYGHLDVKGLHWVVVLSVQKTEKDVSIDLHTWGKLFHITVTHEEFRKMTYEAVLFKVK